MNCLRKGPRILLYFLIIIILPISHDALARPFELDYGGQSFIRSFPTGFFVAPSIGVGQKIWQTNKIPYREMNPWYGYTRLSASAQSSGLVNGLRAEFDLFPISFFGFYAGYDYTIRDLDMQTFDCNRDRCSGKITRQYVGSKLAMGFQHFLFFGDFRYQHNAFNYKDRPFADERATLLCATGSDNLKLIQSALLYKMTDKLQLGPLYLHNQTEKSRNFSRMILFSGRYQFSDLALTAGAGAFSSRFSQEIFSFILGLNWTGERGVRLF